MQRYECTGSGEKFNEGSPPLKKLCGNPQQMRGFPFLCFLTDCDVPYSPGHSRRDTWRETTTSKLRTSKTVFWHFDGKPFNTCTIFRWNQVQGCCALQSFWSNHHFPQPPFSSIYHTSKCSLQSCTYTISPLDHRCLSVRAIGNMVNNKESKFDVQPPQHSLAEIHLQPHE